MVLIFFYIGITTNRLISKFPCFVLLVLSWSTNENPITDNLSRAINYILLGVPNSISCQKCSFLGYSDIFITIQTSILILADQGALPQTCSPPTGVYRSGKLRSTSGDEKKIGRSFISQVPDTQREYIHLWIFGSQEPDTQKVVHFCIFGFSSARHSESSTFWDVWFLKCRN